MSFGICSLSVIPCRKEPSGTSEMVTQLLFGETYTIMEDREDWLQITTNYDNYPCWINAKQHTRITDSDFKSLKVNFLSSELVQVINQSDNHSVFPITIGATLPNFKNGNLKIGDNSFAFEGQTNDVNIKKTVKEIKDPASPMAWRTYMARRKERSSPSSRLRKRLV